MCVCVCVSNLFSFVFFFVVVEFSELEKDIMIKSIRSPWALLIVCFVCGVSGQPQHCVDKPNKPKELCINELPPGNRMNTDPPPCVLSEQTTKCESFGSMPGPAEEGDAPNLGAKPIEINKNVFNAYFQREFSDGKSKKIQEDMKEKFAALSREKLILSGGIPITPEETESILGQLITPKETESIDLATSHAQGDVLQPQ